jgi:O-antigen ligase
VNPASLAASPQWRTGWASASGFDRSGIVAVAILALWPLLSGGWRLTALVIACAVVFGLARLCASSNAWIVPALLVFGLAMVAATDLGGLLSNEASRGPLGYSNAKAALFVQGAVAAVMLAITARSAAVRWVAMIAAASFSIVPLVSGTSAAALSLLLVGGSAITPRRWTRGAISGLMGLFVITLFATALIGIGGDLPGAEGDGRRVTLWGEAVDLMTENPLLGAGNGGFSESSPTAASDEDASWAHNEFLQLGAERGVPVLAASVYVVLWLLSRLRRRADTNALVMPAAAAVAALSVHACIDYIGHFPLIPMFCAALVGAAEGVPAHETAIQASERHPTRWDRR